MSSVSAHSVSTLVLQHLRGNLSEVDQAALSTWLSEDPANSALLERLDDPMQLQALLSDYYARQSDMDQQLARAIPGLVIDSNERTDGVRAFRTRVHRVHFLRSAWFRYAAAIIILFGIGTYLWNTQQNNRTITQTQPVPVEKNEVLPGSDKAVLTLGDGERVVLDSTANPLLAAKGISNQDALIVYSNQGPKTVLNTLSTPKGGQYKIKLPDGTMVWLNAASSITYPTAFIDKNRTVTVKGEAYFEVTANKEKPFIVKTDRDEITVLGTSFNVNSYTDEPQHKISLINGAVKVNEQLLKPGQAYVNGKVITTNIRQDLAWKNGAFDFNNLTIEQAARQIGRWYDVEVRFEGPIPKSEIYGGVSRAVTLQRLIQGMEGEFAHFTLHGKVLVIKSL